MRIKNQATRQSSKYIVYWLLNLAILIEIDRTTSILRYFYLNQTSCIQQPLPRELRRHPLSLHPVQDSLPSILLPPTNFCGNCPCLLLLHISQFMHLNIIHISVLHDWKEDYTRQSQPPAHISVLHPQTHTTTSKLHYPLYFKQPPPTPLLFSE
jgi:hypothetical protein